METRRRLTDLNYCRVLSQARDLDLSNKPNAEGNSRFSFQKLGSTETAARARESVVRISRALSDEDTRVIFERI